MSVPDIDVSAMRERLRKVDTSAEAVAKRVKFLREDYAADGAGVDADLIEALAAELVVEKADNQFTRDARIAHLTKRYGECVAEKEKYRTDHNRISAEWAALLSALDRAEKERDDFAEQIAAYRKGEKYFEQQAVMERENALRAELAEAKRERDEARDYAAQARIRENKTEDRRIHDTDKLRAQIADGIHERDENYNQIALAESDAASLRAQLARVKAEHDDLVKAGERAIGVMQRSLGLHRKAFRADNTEDAVEYDAIVAAIAKAKGGVG